MTHDELLAKIDEHIDYGTCGVCDGKCYKEKNIPWLALRAVVELHKPKGNFADTYVNGEPNSPYCPECIDPDVYPCPTIQQIIENLK